MWQIVTIVFHGVKSSGNSTRVGNHLQNVILFLSENTDLSLWFKSHAICVHNALHSSARLTTNTTHSHFKAMSQNKTYLNVAVSFETILPCTDTSNIHGDKQTGLATDDQSNIGHQTEARIL